MDQLTAILEYLNLIFWKPQLPPGAAPVPPSILWDMQIAVVHERDPVSY